MGKVIVIGNRKGGPGKTTLALALATWLAEGQRVLAIDLDSQGNLTEALGIDLQPAVFAWLGGGNKPQVVRWRESGLGVIAGDATTERVNLILASEGDIGALDRSLAGLRRDYDYIIMDCPPSMSMLTRAAVYAADCCLIPTMPEYLSVAGVRQMVGMIATMAERGRPVELMGIVPNRFDRRTKEHKANLTDLVKAFGAWRPGRYEGKVWPPLRSCIAIAESAAVGVPLWEVALPAEVRTEWESLVERVVSYGTAQRTGV